jgi:hypothetical protein
MNWNSGFSSRYYYTVVDPVSWRDIETHEIISGSITKSGSSLQESADLTLSDAPSNVESWIRIWVDARQEEAGERSALFTGLLQIPSTQFEGRISEFNAQCYSVLKPANDVLLERGWYAPSGISGAQLAAGLLSVGAAPVSYEDVAPELSVNIVAQNNETNLSMARKILDAIGWRIKILGNGEIHLLPKPIEAAAKFDTTTNDVIEMSISVTQDWFSCPNVFRASSGGLTAVARDDNPDSPLSTVARGREIWKEERDVALGTNESITDYTIRRLKELQAPAQKINYNRRYQPDITPGDLVSLNLPEINIDGIYLINKQQIDLGYGARIAEEVVYG